jgi:sulfur carrier protein
LRVTVKLFATFREGREKVQVMELHNGANCEDVISRLNIEKSEVAIILVNGRDGSFEKALTEGDTVSLFPPVGGG